LFVLQIQGRDERIKDEKRRFAFQDGSFLPFLTLAPCTETYGRKLIMQGQNADIGGQLLFLLRQQRYLYHQVRDLTDRQRRLAGKSSPELLLELISGRRKLVEKIRQLDQKLRTIKTNWPKLSPQIQPEQRLQAHKMANQVQEIIGEIRAIAPSETAQALPLNNTCRLDELFAESYTHNKD
jgi:hypothetical protein